MKQEKTMKGVLPFAVDRNGGESLTSQIENGVARGIETGFWKPGDILPTLDELAGAAKVSLIVVRHAMSRLVARGLVKPHSGIGTVVLDGNSRLWRGHVAIITFETRSNFFLSRIHGILQEQLLSANYLPSSVAVVERRPGRFDMSPLDSVLRQPLSLAVILGNLNDAAVARRIVAAGVPVITVSSRPKALPHVTGHVGLNCGAALADFARHCAETGVRRVAQVHCSFNTGDLPGDELRRLGIGVEDWVADPVVDVDPIENVQSGTLSLFEKMLGRGGARGGALPDVLYFNDDYGASGALVSLLSHGVRIPDDVRVVTRAHRGSVPPFPGGLTRIETDPFGAGAVLVGQVMDFLAGRAIAGFARFDATFERGRSF